MSPQQRRGWVVAFSCLLLLFSGVSVVPAAGPDSPAADESVTLPDANPSPAPFGGWALEAVRSLIVRPAGDVPDGARALADGEPVHAWTPGDVFSLHGVDQYRYIVVYTRETADGRVHGCYEVDRQVTGEYTVSLFVHGQEVFGESFLAEQGARFLEHVALESVVITDQTPGRNGESYANMTLGSIFDEPGPTPTTPSPTPTDGATPTPGPTPPTPPPITTVPLPSGTATGTPAPTVPTTGTATPGVTPIPGATYEQARLSYAAGTEAWVRAYGASDPAEIRRELTASKGWYTNALAVANSVDDPANAANLALVRQVSTAYIGLADAALAMYDGGDTYSRGRLRMAGGEYGTAAISFGAAADRFESAKTLFDQATTMLQSVSYAGTEFGDGSGYTATIVPILETKAAYVGEFAAYARGWQHTALAYQASANGDLLTLRSEAGQAMALFDGLRGSAAFGADAASNSAILAALLSG